MAERGVQGGRAEMKALRESEARALELLSGNLTAERRAELEADTLVNFVHAGCSSQCDVSGDEAMEHR